MDCEVVLLLYYMMTLAMAGWVVNIYSNRMLEASRLNPIPEDMMEKYGSDDSDDAQSEHSSEAVSEEEEEEQKEEEREWGGEEKPTLELEKPEEVKRGRRRQRMAWSKMVNEYAE